METFYLIDFENVHNNGIANIDNLSNEEHVHIFSTQNALNIRPEVFWLKSDINAHLVPVRNQSLDMHLVSYLGYIIGIYGKECKYVVVSKDKDYDNIIEFWKKEGCSHICREIEIPKKDLNRAELENELIKRGTNTQRLNHKISEGMNCNFSGEDRSELNNFVQHGLVELGYIANDANKVCKYVITHCNDEQMLNKIHNDIKREFDDYSKVYQDIKIVLEKFVEIKNKSETKREAQVRSFFGQNFKKKIYVDNKEEIIEIMINAKTRQEVNNKLLKLYSDSNVVKQNYHTMKPLIKELPGR